MTSGQSGHNTSASPVSGRTRRVYLNEFNALLGKVAYLPFVSGLLRAYAETSDLIRANYEFMPFIFYQDALERIYSRYDSPSVAGFSVSMWNEQLNLKVAAEVKDKYPDCLIVFGGPSVPHHPQDYFEQYRFIDVAVRSEGEGAFSDILTRFLDSRDFSGIPGVSWRDQKTGNCVRNESERPQARDLDIYPSPYLEGLYEDLIADNEGLEFQQIIETNRGCPFLCTFCFWGQGGLSRKYRYHGVDRVASEIEWAASHKIRYIFNADSNFGMHKRDAEIAQILVDVKERFGYPDKFRTTYGKNTDERIFQVAKLLHDHDLGRGVTLSRQSNDSKVLSNIKRDNIKMSTYKNLQTRFNETDVPVYTELILGLPGESEETWTTGIEQILQSGLKNDLIIPNCQVYPNTELADPEYLKKFGIVTHRIPLTQIHGSHIRSGNLVTEYEDIVITTDSMPLDKWRRMRIFSWFTMLLHSLKLGFFVLYYLNERHGIAYTDLISYISSGSMSGDTGQILRKELAEFEAQIDRILAGEGQGCELPEFGNIYWYEEEASFLRNSNRLDEFYDELEVLLVEFMNRKGIAYDVAEIGEVVQYQRLRIPSHFDATTTNWRFNFNIPEYFETCFRSDAQPLVHKPQILTVRNANDTQGNKSEYAIKTVLWGRTSGTMLTEVSWRDEISHLASKSVSG
jgi:putative methyltransferase